MLFNREGNGTLELQMLTGGFSASNDFAAVVNEVKLATGAVAALVGWPVVRKAEDAYEKDDQSQRAFIDAVRLPIAMQVLITHSNDNLVSHDDSGRTIHVDENQKIPFEWMIDRDDRAMRDKYYRSLDLLYAFLEENNIQEWTESDIRKNRLQSIIKTIGQFEDVYPIDHSYYVFYMFQPLAIEIGHRTVRKMVGPDNWTAISGNGCPDDKKTLQWLCRRYTVLSAVVTGVRRWSLEVFPLEIARRFAPTYQGNRSSRAALRTEMEDYLRGIEEQLTDLRDEIAEELAGGMNPYEGFDPMPHNDPRNKFFTAQ